MSDHIPDVTKMIGETPRTESFNCYDSGCDDPLHAWGAFSAELERELNAVSKERDEAVFVTEKVLKEFSEHSRSRCKAIDELNAANERIKRLEEAGDRMALILKSTRQHWYSTDQCEVVAFDWNEAKEDKPCIKQLKTKSCIYCMKVECECSDFDVSADMGAKG